MFFKLKTELTYCFLHSCRPWILDIHAIEFSSEMQWYFSRVFVSFLATVLQRFAVSVCQPLSARPGRPSIAQMQHRMPVARASAQAVGFKCSNCNGIFDSRIAVACHRRFPGSQGTACADPRSTQSLSFTGRAGMATGILRQHPGTLGALSDCCPSCDLRALLLLLLPFSTWKKSTSMVFNRYNSRIIVE